jgi:hypothetical protein
MSNENKKQYSLVKIYPGIPPDWEIDMIIEKGKFTYFPVDKKYRSKSIYFWEVENFSDYWIEVKEKTYKIIAYYQDNCGRFHIYDEKHVNWNIIEKMNYKIHSVERLSDNKIFKIKDETNAGIIAFFELDGNIIIPYVGVKMPLQADFELIQKNKPVIFISDDNVEMYEGDSYYYSLSDIRKEKCIVQDFAPDQKDTVRFSSEEVMDEYILVNKKVFSIEDIAKIYSTAKEGYKKPNLSYGKQSQELRDFAKSIINKSIKSDFNASN